MRPDALRLVGWNDIAGEQHFHGSAWRDTLRDSATIGVEQNRPILTPGVQKPAVSAAIARSQLATNWQPAALARPCTSAMTGLG